MISDRKIAIEGILNFFQSTSRERINVLYNSVLSSRRQRIVSRLCVKGAQAEDGRSQTEE